MGQRVPGQSVQSAALSTLAKTAPIAQSAITQGQQEAQKVRLQQSVQQAVQGGKPLNAASIQQSGAQQAAAQGQTAVQGQQAVQNQSQQVAQLGLQQQSLESRKALADKKLGIDRKARELKGKLNTLGNGLEDKLINQQMEFQRDEMGRTFFNERQLADWKIKTIKDEEEFKQYEMDVQQASKKRMQMLKTAYSKIQQSLSQGHDEKETTLDNNQKKDLLIAKRELEKKMQDEANKQANRAGMFGAIGTIIGGAGGALIGGPAGAAVGAQLGQGLGGVAAATTS